MSDSGSDMSSGIGFLDGLGLWYSHFPPNFISWSDGIIMIDTPLLVIVMKYWVSTILGYLSIDGVMFSNRHPDLLEIWMP